MKVISVAVLLLLCGTALAENTKHYDYTETIVFSEFHDPGYLVTDDGRKFWFEYEGFTYEIIEKWKPGRQLLFVYSVNDGVKLIDIETKIEAIISKTAEHPIDSIEKECIENNGSTRGISMCYSKSYELWDAEMNRIYRELEATAPIPVFEKIRGMQQAWVIYRDARFKANQSVFSNDAGTISIIESHARAVGIVESQAAYLNSLLRQ